MSEIGERLRDVIAERGVKQSWLAMEADVPEETISRILTGATADPKIGTVRKIAAALQMTVSDLIGETRLPFSTMDRAEAERFLGWFTRVFDIPLPGVEGETNTVPSAYTPKPSGKDDELSEPIGVRSNVTRPDAIGGTPGDALPGRRHGHTKKGGR